MKMKEDISGMRETGKRLKQAIETGDLRVVRDAADELIDVLDRNAEVVDQLEHVGRLLDLGRMAASLVHELRQPLLGIKAFSQMVVAKADDDYVKNKAESIHEQSVRMERLIEHVRSYGRSAPEETLSLCGVNDAARVALEILAPRIRAARANVTLALAEELPSVMADPIGLQQILINLVSNAFEAAGEGGEVTVETDRDDRSVRVRVRDDGPGISEQIRPRLFKPFATGKADGTGLGLYVCREVAERMGATLELLDAEVGATFELNVPVLNE